MKLIKGNVYIMQMGNQFWLIQQTSQRSWDGFCFSHYDIPFNYVHGNSMNVIKNLRRLYPSDAQENIWVFKTWSKGDIRRKMFNILKYGNPNGGES